MVHNMQMNKTNKAPKTSHTIRFHYRSKLSKNLPYILTAKDVAKLERIAEEDKISVKVLTGLWIKEKLDNIK